MFARLDSESPPRTLYWWWIGFVVVFLFRYLRLVVNFIAFHSYKPIPPPEKPKHTADSVTVVLPTLATNPAELVQTLHSACSLKPREIFVVTTDNNLKRVQNLVMHLHHGGRIKVLSVPRPNKRRQIIHAIPKVETDITLLLDDDVQLPARYMEWSLAPFHDEAVGGVGTNQALRRERSMNSWNFLGAIYLARRNFDCTACNWIDGGLPCLSGRAVMYRSTILKDSEFQAHFGNETWSFLGRSYSLPVDDDNFITRWLFSHNFKIKMQYHEECEVVTTLEPDSNYINQCVRWQRSNWRSNITSLCIEKNVQYLFPWSTYAVFVTTILQWAFFWDLCMCLFLFKGTQYWAKAHAEATFFVFVLWWVASKIIKFLGYFKKHMEDLFHFWWLLFFFGYFHNLIKGYSLCTIRRTTWGSKQEADETDVDLQNLQRVPKDDSKV